MDIELKEKIPVTPELLNDLVSKSWLELEHLQAQANNLDNNPALQTLLNNLITSYYVFIGGIENLQVGINTMQQPSVSTSDELQKKLEPDILDDLVFDKDEVVHVTHDEPALEATEPFEYFVDFDEPVGDPLSDDDLYGNL